MTEDYDELFRKWNNWIEEIQKEITELLSRRHIFKIVQKIISANPNIHKPSSFYDFISINYEEAMAIGIRRQRGDDPREISLYNLLNDVKEHPDVMSRHRYICMMLNSDKELEKYELLLKNFKEGTLNRDDRLELVHKDTLVKKANEEFDEFAGKGEKCANPLKVEEDLKQLINITQDIKTFVDKRVAHTDKIKNASVDIPTYEDMYKCIDFLEELTIKYLLMLTASSYELLPKWQYDWTAIFREPWIPKDEWDAE